MILFDEPRKYNWHIKYLVLENNALTTIAEGKCYDFIPHKNEIIVLNNIVYLVGAVLYDFDESVILISLDKKSKE